MTNEQFALFTEWIKAVIQDQKKHSDCGDYLRRMELEKEVKEFMVDGT